MNENKKTNISFLFGAGTEGKSNFNLPLGYEFLRNSFFYNNERNDVIIALKNFFTESYFGNTYKYRQDKISISKKIYSNFLLSKAIDDENFFENNINILKNILLVDDKKILSNKYNRKIPPKQKDFNREDLYKDFKYIIENNVKDLSCIENEINRKLFDSNSTVGINFALNFLGTLDGYFHSIINPQKYGIGIFSKIFNYYWFCYFTIVEAIVQNSEDIDTIKDYVETNGNIRKLNYSKILNGIKAFTTGLYEIPLVSNNTYYEYISQKLNENKNIIKCTGVATTNYYNYVEETFNESNHDDFKVAYLNGKLCLFEFPELLETKNLKDHKDNNVYDNSKLFFPFIFGQSFVKPIVNSFQICEFKEFYEILNKSDILCILGYNINEDDNHINAFIHEFIEKGNKIIFVTEKKKEEKCEEIKNKIHEKLKITHIDNCIELCIVKYGDNKDVIDRLFESVIKLMK